MPEIVLAGEIVSRIYWTFTRIFCETLCPAASAAVSVYSVVFKGVA
jgi:hypothetical protein